MERRNIKLVQNGELFGEGGEEAVPNRLMTRIRRTMLIGGVVMAVFVIGLFVWAMTSSVAGAVSATGVVKVESSRKTVKRLEPGIIREIFVHEGDHVKAGQLLFVFDDSQPKAQLSELQSAYDSALAERARYEAEATDRASISFPPELLSRSSDPQVAALITVQRALFKARREVLSSQVNIGQQRVQQLNSQIQGVRAQVASTDQQLKLNQDELAGVQTLYDSGYAPKTRLLALQRSAAGLGGNRGEQSASVARTQQAIGETRLQMVSSRQARISEAATGLQSDQDKLSAIGARLAATKDVLSHSRIYAPVDGSVLNLTQFTIGGVTGPAETLLDIVPNGEPLILEMQVAPKDAHAVYPGQKAIVTLTAYNSRTTPKINANVVNLSADQTINPHTGMASFTAELRIPPDQLRRLPSTVKIYPGMPVSASIVNGERSILSYLVSPIVDVFSESMHEQ